MFRSFFDLKAVDFLLRIHYNNYITIVGIISYNARSQYEIYV